jgi:carboxyl-terminal processing protease
VIPALDESSVKEISIVRAEVELKDKLANAELLETPAEIGRPSKLGWIIGLLQTGMCLGCVSWIRSA